MNSQVVVVEPSLASLGRSQLGGDGLYVGAFLAREGFDIAVANPNEEAWCGTTCKTIVLVLSQTDWLAGQRILRIADRVMGIRQADPECAVVAIGPIATALKAWLLEHKVADAVVSDGWVDFSDTATSQRVQPLAKALERFYGSDVLLDAAFLESLVWEWPQNVNVTLYSSRGCSHACTFCGYNQHLTRRHDRSIESLVEDMNVVNRVFGTTRFALSDSSFAENRASARFRLEELLRAQRRLRFSPSLTLGMRADAIGADTIGLLKSVRVSAVLMGMESISEAELTTVFGKYQDVARLGAVCDALEASGIQPVTSYIMFHPWTTLEGLRSSTRALVAFGRERIPQLFANSVLTIVPGTRVECMAKRDGLLIEGVPLSEWRFLDSRVEHILFELRKNRDRLFARQPYTLREVAIAKAEEWRMLWDLVGLGR